MPELTNAEIDRLIAVKVMERLCKKFIVSAKESCWNWTGYKTPKGYGILVVGGKDIKAHRLSYEIFVGKIPDGKCVCHKCDNPSCVNPYHLFVGTIQENNIDRDTKAIQSIGRKYVSGSLHGNSMLNENDVIEIRRLWKTGRHTQKEIGKMFSVSSSNIYLICKRKAWTHI